MTDGGTSMISGAFEAVKQTSFAFDYKGSAFNALFAGAPIDDAFIHFSRRTWSQALPSPQIGAFVDLLDAGVRAQTVYSDTSCGGRTATPRRARAAVISASSRSPATTADTFSYGNPFDFRARAVNLDIDLSEDVQIAPAREDARAPAREHHHPGADPELDGKPIQPVARLPAETSRSLARRRRTTRSPAGVGTEPEITWSPPTLGKPTSYHVNVVDLTDS